MSKSFTPTGEYLLLLAQVKLVDWEEGTCNADNCRNLRLGVELMAKKKEVGKMNKMQT